MVFNYRNIFFLMVFLCCSSSLYAQDCTLTIASTAPEESFEIYQNNTVVDSRTGLMWMRCPDGLSGSSCQQGNAAQYTWRGALERVDSISQSGGVASYSDWRLPNIKELRSIAEYSCSEPAINTTVFPGLEHLNKGLPFWSSSPARTAGGRTVWTLWFKHGRVDSSFYTIEKYGGPYGQIDRLDKHYLRLVRER